VGAVVGAVVGVLAVDPVLVVPPHALTPITRTRPMTMSKARFGTTFMSVLLSKQGSSLVSTTPDVCDEVVLTIYVHNDVVHESGRKFALLQVIRQEVTRASSQAQVYERLCWENLSRQLDRKKETAIHVA